MDNNFHVVGIFLDPIKAHDDINHDILLYELEHYGVRGILNLWLKSCLLLRNQFIMLTQTDFTNSTLDT